ncbi:MAG: hypothetical protein EOO56_26870, partial [Hymenobacter sp.]
MNVRVFRSVLISCWLLSVAGWAAKPPAKSKKDEVVTITTSLGDIRLLLFEDTPLHRANFLRKAKTGFYNGTTFHRIIPQFMVQGRILKQQEPNITQT